MGYDRKEQNGKEEEWDSIGLGMIGLEYNKRELIINLPHALGALTNC